MKHVTLSLLCAGLVTLAACNKEKTMQPTQQPATENGKSISGAVKKEKGTKPPKFSHAWWHPNMMRCQGRYGNCVVIETIVVTPHFARVIASAANGGSSAKVGATFRIEELSDVVKYCLTENGYAEKLQSGNYFIARTHDDGKEACYIAGTRYPVTAENMEFAFQFAYGEIEE
jgi:hypothetical protein